MTDPHNKELRAYYFTNMYLSSIQQGIQPLHATARMFTKYTEKTSPKTEMLYDWALNHETVILLNAGYTSEVRNLLNFFNTAQNPYPYCEFYESQDALDGALTSVGIILPDEIYEASRQLRGKNITLESLNEGLVSFWTDPNADGESDIVSYDITKWQRDLIIRLNNYDLAR